MNNCKHCEEVFIESKIGSPKDFERAIRIIRANLEDGTIVESDYWPEGCIGKDRTPFSEVTGRGVYTEDVYIYYFECPDCHQLFKLTCDTYHGGGGEWKPMTDERDYF